MRPTRNSMPTADLLDSARAHAQGLASLVDGNAEVSAQVWLPASCLHKMYAYWLLILDARDIPRTQHNHTKT